MIRKIHFLCLFFLFFMFIGTVSANEDSNIDNSISENHYSLETNDVEMFYNDGTSFNVKILDNNNSIADKNVNITINGMSYNRKTNSSGEAKLNIYLIPGVYKIKTDSILDNQKLSVINTISIKEFNTTFIGKGDVELGYGEGKYEVTLIGGKNKILDGKEVVFSINGKDYKRTTDQQGKASLNIYLNPGTYKISAIFHEIYYKSSSINSIINVGYFNTRFVSTSLKSNISKINYSVKLVYGDMCPVQNHYVVFSVGGSSSLAKTDELGIATLNKVLPAGKYDISFEFIGSVGFFESKGFNTVEIDLNDSTEGVDLQTNDVEMFFIDGTSFDAKVLGEDVKDKKVNFTINGITYSRVTNNQGIAKLNLYLAPGEYSIITTAILDNQLFSVVNKITIKEMKTYLLANKVFELGFGEGKYCVYLKDVNNKSLSDKSVVISINGKDYTRITDKDGLASLNIYLLPGSYSVSASFSSVCYSKSFTSSLINVGIYETRFLSNFTKFNDTQVSFVFKLVDSRNHPVKNRLVFTYLENKLSILKTDENGVAIYKNVLNPGTYKISFEFNGDAGYLKSSGFNSFVIGYENIILHSEDFETYVDSPIYYLVSASDSNGLKIANQTIFTDIYKDGNFIDKFESKTYEDGIARLTFDLNPGNYVAKNYLFKDGTCIYNNVTIKPASLMVDSSNLLLNRKGEDYTITIRNNETNSSVANISVTISINGKDYKRLTNEKGIVKLNINLNFGEYVISYYVDGKSKYPNLSGSNKIVIQNQLISSNICFLSSDIIRKGTYCQVKLVDINGIPLKGKEVYIIVNKKEYKRITDENGIAKLQIYLNDGKYFINADFHGDNLFARSLTGANIVVNTNPTFNYTLSLKRTVDYKGFSCSFMREFTIDYGDNHYELDYSIFRDCPKLTEKDSYFINCAGIKSSYNIDQGLEFKLVSDSILITFYGKTSDVGQFSVIFTKINDKTKINYIIDNEIVATVLVESCYASDDFKVLNDLGYSFYDLDYVNSSFKSFNNTIERKISLEGYDSISLKNHHNFKDFDTIQTYLLTSKKIDGKIMENAANNAINFKEEYPKYAYELYLASLMTMLAADSSGDNLANQLNVTWSKKNQIILTNIDKIQLSLDARADVNVFGDEVNRKLFKLNYGLLFSLCEEFGIKSTGNNASSVVGDLFKGIYDGKEFIIDEKGDLIILKLVNSSNYIKINIKTGDVYAMNIIDVNELTKNIAFKGCSCMSYISKYPNVEKNIGLSLNTIKRSANDIFNLIFSIDPKAVFYLLKDNVKEFFVLGISYKLSYNLHPIALITLGVDIQQITLDYRNKFALDDKWQYFSSHGAIWDVKTIAITNKETGLIDYVEIPYDDYVDNKLNMEKAVYIDSVSGKRNLTSDEKIKYEDYDVFAKV